MTFSVAPSIYEDLKAYGRPVGLSSIHALSLNPSSDLSVRECCQLLGGTYLYAKIAFTRPEPCSCRKKWSEACGPYLKTKKILDMIKRPNEAGDPSRCYCPGSRAETRFLRKEVKVSALRFCQNLFEHASGPYQLPAWTKWNVWSWWEWILTRNMVRGKARDILAGASARCQRALAHSWSSSSWAISGGREKSAGRLDRLGHPWKWHLDQVCQDECEELVDMMKKSSDKIIDSMSKGKVLHVECADRVVKQVEANLLGCCGRSCGWDGHSCALWPFLEENQQQLWQVECCGEYTVLKGSDRERMCDSVLTAEQKKSADADDPDGTDEDAESVGQNEGTLFPLKLPWPRPDGFFQSSEFRVIALHCARHTEAQALDEPKVFGHIPGGHDTANQEAGKQHRPRLLKEVEEKETTPVVLMKLQSEAPARLAAQMDRLLEPVASSAAQEIQGRSAVDVARDSNHMDLLVEMQQKAGEFGDAEPREPSAAGNALVEAVEALTDENLLRLC
eukprot:symbB.v1.2.038103.t1/scaffold5826.1/size23311/2